MLLNSSYPLKEITTLSGRYAKALFSLCENKENAIEVFFFLKKFFFIFPKFEKVLFSQLLTNKEVKIFWEVLADSFQFSYPLLDFFVFLYQEKRFKIWKRIAEDFEKIYNENLNIFTLKVYTPDDFPPEKIEKIKEVLTSSSQKFVKIETISDPSLLAGIVVQSGGAMIDASLKGYFNRLATTLKG